MNYIKHYGLINYFNTLPPSIIGVSIDNPRSLKKLASGKWATEKREVKKYFVIINYDLHKPPIMRFPQN